MSEHPPVWTIVVAGGVGRRFGGAKQFEALDGERRVIDVSVATAAAVGDGVVAVVPSDRVEAERERLAASVVVAGGTSRSASVRAGLAQVPAEAAVVCVHDAARPFASIELFRRVIAAVSEGIDAAVPGLEVSDTIKTVDAASLVVATPDRAMLRAVQTPQAFSAAVLRRAHQHEAEGSDDSALVERIGGAVRVVKGEREAFKITVADDLDRARAQVGAMR